MRGRDPIRAIPSALPRIASALEASPLQNQRAFAIFIRPTPRDYFYTVS